MLGSPSLPFMYISASAPDAPPFSDTMTGCFIRSFFWIAACIMRAIWSDAPPAPAATTISTGLAGSHATAGVAASSASILVALMRFFMRSLPVSFPEVRLVPDLDYVSAILRILNSNP